MLRQRKETLSCLPSLECKCPSTAAYLQKLTLFCRPGNHSVTQSSFDAPCDPLGNGFDSGNILISDSSSGFPTWNLTITNASQPIWFFCKQLVPQPHCNVGMVGSINAPSSGQFTFEGFRQAAMSHQGNSGVCCILGASMRLSNRVSRSSNLLVSSSDKEHPLQQCPAR